MDLFLDGLLAIARIRVIAEPLRRIAALGFEGLEEIGKGLGVVTGFVKDDRAYGVGLRFVGAPQRVQRAFPWSVPWRPVWPNVACTRGTFRVP